MKEIYEKEYDYVFVTKLLTDSNNNLFYGGAELHLYNILKILKGLNKSLLVIQKGNENKIFEKEGFTIAMIKSKGIWNYKLRLRKILNHVKTKVIHFNDFGLDDFIKKRRGIIYSVTCHGTNWDFPTKEFPEPYVNNTLKTRTGSKLLKKWYIFNQNRILKRFDRILSVDTTLLRYAQMFQTENRIKVKVIPNFVDLKKFNQDNSPIKKADYFRILFPRNISYARGVHLLIPIANILKKKKLNFKIQIMGAGIKEIGGSKYEKVLKEQIINEKLENYFEFSGRVDHDKVPELMKNSDLIIIPTIFSEGTSLSCLEGMACKKIVLATNIGGLNDIIINKYNGFLTNPAPNEIADCIAYIIKNFDKLDFIKENAFKLIEEVYTLEKWKEKVKEYFLEVEKIQ